MDPANAEAGNVYLSIAALAGMLSVGILAWIAVSAIRLGLRHGKFRTGPPVAGSFLEVLGWLTPLAIVSAAVILCCIGVI